jgi:7,8-dihydropterin-6-yl-methyl-4-(beta-D-ribofuranosyl)aminobenzene 5'-phosphate synthase
MKELTIKIVFDNKTLKPDLLPGWGFACVIHFAGKAILFDTGADGAVLLSNMEKLNIEPGGIEAVVLSHAHGDHANGLGHILAVNSDLTVYLPQSFPNAYKQDVISSGAKVEEITRAKELFSGVYTTGEMMGIIPEQALAITTSYGTVVITGCAHPGVVNIVQLAKELTADEIYLVLGGFHFPKRSVVDSFRDLGVQKAAPCHCTGDEALDFFHEAYGYNFIEVGVGKEIEIG